MQLIYKLELFHANNTVYTEKYYFSLYIGLQFVVYYVSDDVTIVTRRCSEIYALFMICEPLFEIFRVLLHIKLNEMEDVERQTSRLWRAFRTVKEMVRDRVRRL